LYRFRNIIAYFPKVKQQNRVLCHPLKDLEVMYTVHLLLVGKRVVNCLLLPIKLFSPALMVKVL